MIPGRMLHRLAARICSTKTLEQVVEPAIADLHKEYHGVAAAHFLPRGWILIVGYCAILKVIAICAVSVAPVRDDERRALRRTVGWSLGMIVLVAALLTLPPFFAHPGWGWYSLTTIVPQAVPLAIPMGIAFGLAFALSARPSRNLSKLLLIGALSASVVSFGTLAWLVPAAGQAFREITFRELRARGYQGPITLQKGFSEMTLSELRGQVAHFSAEGEPRIARGYALGFHRRFSLAAATLALVSLLIAAPSTRRGLRALTAFGASFAYWMLMFAGEWGNRRGYLTVPIGAWLPNLVLIASAIFIASSRLRGSLRSAV